MSIHNFSETAFDSTAKEILIKESIIRDRITKKAITNPDEIASDASLRENFDLSSLDIAELVVALEETYGIKTIDISTRKIDSIKDIRKLFFESLKNTRQMSKLKGKITNREIVGSLIEIILEHGDYNPQEVYASAELKHDLKMDSLDILEVLMEFEKKYNIRIECDENFKRIGTINEFAQALYNCINPAKTPEVKKEIQPKDKKEIFGIMHKYLNAKKTFNKVTSLFKSRSK